VRRGFGGRRPPLFYRKGLKECIINVPYTFVQFIPNIFYFPEYTSECNKQLSCRKETVRLLFGSVLARKGKESAVILRAIQMLIKSA